MSVACRLVLPARASLFPIAWTTSSKQGHVHNHLCKSIWQRQPARLLSTSITRHASETAGRSPELLKGKLLSTPSRLLKLVIPLRNARQGNQAAEPLALLVHPQQPLSYLERLIQSELPSTQNPETSRNGPPSVHFKAPAGTRELQDSRENGWEVRPPGTKRDDTAEDLHEDHPGGEITASSENDSGDAAQGDLLVRWSASTEIGDFIRDAARWQEFRIEVCPPTTSSRQHSQGKSEEIRVSVPSFNDRTHYLRQRLRHTSARLSSLASLKAECDAAAHKSAQRIAMGGAAMLVGYWYIVYRLTFETDLGWDVMEPITYLVGLSSLIAGYLWFLFHNREVSYRAALNLTVSKRQKRLYDAKGFDQAVWQALVDEANAYRAEVKQIAREYDVEWDESRDVLGNERVKQAMREERRKDRSTKGREEEEEDEKEDKRKEEKEGGKKD